MNFRKSTKFSSALLCKAQLRCDVQTLFAKLNFLDPNVFFCLAGATGSSTTCALVAAVVLPGNCCCAATCRAESLTEAIEGLTEAIPATSGLDHFWNPPGLQTDE